MISHDMTSRVHCYAMLCFALGKQYLGVTSQTLSHKPSVIELVQITRELYCSWRRGIILCLLILSRGGRRKEGKPYNAPTRKLNSIPTSPLNCIFTNTCLKGWGQIAKLLQIKIYLSDLGITWHSCSGMYPEAIAQVIPKSVCGSCSNPHGKKMVWNV